MTSIKPTSAHPTRPRTKSPRPTAPSEAKPKPVTATYLRNSALYTLSQRALTVTALKDLLCRRAQRRLKVNHVPDDVRPLVDQAVAELVELGLVDDARFAEMKVGQLLRKGQSKAQIGQRLAAKGITPATAAAALGHDVDDLTQARVFAARKRLGRHRRGPSTPKTEAKDMRALARAGFSRRVAVQVLSESDE